MTRPGHDAHPPAAEAGAPLCRRYDTALLDLDGVVYRGDQPIPGAAHAIAAASAAGMRIVYLTNNASRTATAIADQLTGMGIAATADQVVTSAQAVAAVLQQQLAPAQRVLVVGGDGLRTAVTDAGFVAVSAADDHPAAVVQGYAPDLDYSALAEATLAVARGLPWIAANLDNTLPAPRGLLPGNGALVQAVATATGRRPDQVAGKPARPLYDEACRRSAARRPLVVGDRLDTDIAGARAAGLASLLVLTGVTDRAMLAETAGPLLPNYVGDDLTALLAAPRHAAHHRQG